jgi:hypothetical protein
MAEGVKKGFCRFQVGRLEPFAEPVVDGIQKRQRIGGTALIAQQPGKARGGAQAGLGIIPASSRHHPRGARREIVHKAHSST